MFFLGKKKILFASKVRYLGVMIDSKLRDDTDINRQGRSVYYIANKLYVIFLDV